MDEQWTGLRVWTELSSAGTGEETDKKSRSDGLAGSFIAIQDSAAPKVHKTAADLHGLPRKGHYQEVHVGAGLAEDPKLFRQRGVHKQNHQLEPSVYFSNLNNWK